MNYFKYLLGKCYNSKFYKWIIFVFGIGLLAFTFFIPLFQYGYGSDREMLSSTNLYFPCVNFLKNRQEMIKVGIYDKVLKYFIFYYVFAIANIFINSLVYNSAFRHKKIKLWNFSTYLIPVLFIIIAACYLSTENPKGFIVLNYGFYLYFVIVGLLYLFCLFTEKYKNYSKPSKIHNPSTKERIAQLENQIEELKKNNSQTN